MVFVIVLRDGSCSQVDLNDKERIIPNSDAIVDKK